MPKKAIKKVETKKETPAKTKVTLKDVLCMDGITRFVMNDVKYGYNSKACVVINAKLGVKVFVKELLANLESEVHEIDRT